MTRPAIQEEDLSTSAESFAREIIAPRVVNAAPIKAAVAQQLKIAMRAKKLSKKAMATLMKTSRTQIDRLLDPRNGNVTLSTLQKAAMVVGREVRIEIV